MSDTAIRVDGIGKKYRIGVLHHDTLRDRIAHGVASLFHRNGTEKQPPRDELWALRDVSLQVERGEVLGIIGRNGAGKSTLLKILSRITEPTEGTAEIYGRVGSLLEVGTGFHAELSGRENIYLNGAILGMTRREIDRKLDEIVAFAEVEKFLETPVKRYSSGMYVRLAFAVAAHLEPEILLVDEVLAVGDVGFQQKCLGKMNEVAHEGRTVLFVSHNMGVIQNLCTRAITLRDGRVVFDGAADEAVQNYLQHLSESADFAFERNPERSGSGQVRLTGGRILNHSGTPSQRLVAGERAAFEFAYENRAQLDKAAMIATIYNQAGIAVTNFDMRLTDRYVDDLGAQGTFTCTLPNLPLPKGQYRVAAAVYVDGTFVDHIPNAFVFSVESSTFYETGKTPKQQSCACMIHHTWQHEVTHPVANTVFSPARHG